MARTVKWTDTANRDLIDVVEFIRRNSQFYTTTLVQNIKIITQSLKIFTKQNQIIPKINIFKIHELFINNYRLIYKVTSDRVFILGFVHGARNLTALWDRRSGPRDKSI